MTESCDSRRHPRIRVRVTNALRIKGQDGDCLVDILDISQNGVGVEFMDLFDVLIFNKGDIVKLKFLLKPDQVTDIGASEILNAIRTQKMADKGATQTTDTSGSSKELIETDAKIVWTYLNRLGLEFIKSD